MQKVGILGSAQAEFAGDWLDPIGLSSVLSGTAGSLSASSDTCTLTGGLQIRVVTSKIGPVADAQDYVAAVEVRAVSEAWTWHSAASQFTHWVSVQFEEVENANVQRYREREGTTWLPALPGVSPSAQPGHFRLHALLRLSKPASQQARQSRRILFIILNLSFRKWPHSVDLAASSSPAPAPWPSPSPSALPPPSPSPSGVRASEAAQC